MDGGGEALLFHRQGQLDTTIYKYLFCAKCYLEQTRNLT